MAYLFLDNRGRANIYNKQEMVPGRMAVSVVGQLNTTKDKETGESTPTPTNVILDVFFTKVSVSRKASRQVKRALDRSYHIFKFGEGEADIQLSGIAIAESQGSEKPTQNTALETRLQELGTEVDTGDDDETFFKKEKDNVASDRKNWSSRFFSDVRDKINNKDSIFVKTQNAISGGIDMVMNTVVAPVITFVPDVIKTAKSMLGIGAPGQVLDRTGYSKNIGTITELNAFFNAFNSGNNEDLISCFICGIPVEGLLDSLTFESMAKGNGYVFTLGLKGLKFQDRHSKTAWEEPILLHPKGNDTLRGILQGGTELAFSALRTNSSFGRLLG